MSDIDAMLMTKSSPLIRGGVTGAQHFAAFLANEAAAEGALCDGYELADGLVEEIEKHFLGKTMAQLETEIDRAKPPIFAQFSSVDYWLEHGRFTGDLMAEFARRHGGSANLYRQLGRIHDADYLRYPHKDRNSTRPVHPMALALYLRDNEVPAIVQLAIMEHAGYIGAGENFSGKLSAALSACDDLATYASAVDARHPHVGQELSPFARDLMKAVPLPAFRLDVSTSCPDRVLAHVDLFINNCFGIALALP